MGRIPALDGWRGIAIALVLFDHIQGSLRGRPFYSWCHTGYHGVMVFFVLSGYLITSKLISEEGGLRGFYMRRFFRLMPAAWVFLGFVCALDALGSHLTSSEDLWACLFFYRDIVGSGKDFVSGHFWSLSAEEKFYLIWPSLMLLPRQWAKGVAIFGSLGCVAVRIYLWHSAPFEHHFAYPALWAGGIFVGCLAALIPFRARFVPIALGVFALCIYVHSEYLLILEQVAIAVLIVSATQDSRLTPLLSWAPLAWLGRISYSVYIWQGLFMPFRSVYALAMIPVFALASYYMIEKPFIRFGDALPLMRYPIRTVANDGGRC